MLNLVIITVVLAVRAIREPDLLLIEHESFLYRYNYKRKNKNVVFIVKSKIPDRQLH